MHVRPGAQGFVPRVPHAAPFGAVSGPQEPSERTLTPFMVAVHLFSYVVPSQPQTGLKMLGHEVSPPVAMH